MKRKERKVKPITADYIKDVMAHKLCAQIKGATTQQIRLALNYQTHAQEQFPQYNWDKVWQMMRDIAARYNVEFAE